ncbi:MAG: RsmD family RNA methyltransferase [Flavobacterium nitrogenifigens]|jgi:16S rRNA (guanine966-N2)-methyltransferase|uniref:16S rRNA (Guanine(966)-N(2))-methyltransferase RsmD n=1 Tax=Flavobacterium nitrogenifigens TaxID=1617283 RepID=A0A521DZP9_9FLAO|nr:MULTISPECIES: RsmD family RNA methyltransferase [Flavobacterium]KAF2334015.1 methyltransferase [Flavobacterium nitrogenifigens]MDQ6530189.1 RsmD family RNA methyltransferase [Flavobacterium sp. LHD-85]MDQ8013772.1 RsmD family RNA methyltransferase [Flavobacterium nitrogenifigens]SMO76330.1 16S rRNA (guanine(966)-N(2))-methyltransferase RsmD [Flavobacterium nitrogenifigens]
MRIISGKYKGRRIFPPKNLPVRPTTDMSKEALFNVLNNHFSFDSLKVLDLFSGTGNISYEFASRGSAPITSVDGDFGCVKFIKQVSSEYDFDIAATKSDVFKFLENSKTTYDIIFADPPYGLDQATFEKIVLTVFERDLLEEDGMMIIEHSKYTKLDHMINFSFQKSYGGSFFSFFELNSTDDDEELPHDVSKKETEEDEG